MSNISRKKVKLERKYPKDLQSHFVSNIVVQHESDHFILSFFEVWAPAIIGETEEEKMLILESIDSVEANCVARIVLTHDRMMEFAQLINDNISSFNRSKIDQFDQEG